MGEPPRHRHHRRTVTQRIAQRLHETDAAAIDQIGRILREIGAPSTFALVEAAEALDAAGGEPTVDGSRRRTLGGVFFALVRKQVTYQQRGRIWPEMRQRAVAAAGPRMTPPTHPTTAPLDRGRWEDRLAYLQAIGEDHGGATKVNCTIIGRPGEVIIKADVVVAAMPTVSIPALPKGVPQPPESGTMIMVYIARKQWQRVAAALDDPADALIIEGFAIYDEAIHGLALLAMVVTSKKLQAAKRRPTLPPGASE